MDFLLAFEDIDRDYSGEITRDELVEYLRSKQYEEVFVEKWLNLFDIDHSGTITLEEFCEVLGLEPPQEYLEKLSRKRAALSQLHMNKAPEKGPRILDSDPEMPPALLTVILRAANLAIENASRTTPPPRSTKRHAFHICRQLKLHLDDWKGGYWHVVASTEPFNSSIEHESGCFLHFAVQNWGILLWKTPPIGDEEDDDFFM